MKFLWVWCVQKKAWFVFEWFRRNNPFFVVSVKRTTRVIKDKLKDCWWILFKFHFFDELSGKSSLSTIFMITLHPCVFFVMFFLKIKSEDECDSTKQLWRYIRDVRGSKSARTFWRTFFMVFALLYGKFGLGTLP